MELPTTVAINGHSISKKVLHTRVANVVLFPRAALLALAVLPPLGGAQRLVAAGVDEEVVRRALRDVQQRAQALHLRTRGEQVPNLVATQFQTCCNYLQATTR